jgi:hypothetical protein
MQEHTVRKLEVFIRDIINEGKNCINWDKLEIEKKTFLLKTKELFKFEQEDGWKFLLSCLDTVGDSQMAINYFLKSQENNEIENGLSYLKIYGVLNAIYIQQLSIIKLGDLVKQNQINIKSEFDSLKITFLRNAIASHPVNYLNIKGTEKEIKTYRVVRGSLNNLSSLQVQTHESDFLNINVYKCIDDYQAQSVKILKIIAKKLITNRYQKESSKSNQLLELLENKFK